VVHLLGVSCGIAILHRSPKDLQEWLHSEFWILKLVLSVVEALKIKNPQKNSYLCPTKYKGCPKVTG
jgi:hypothetical protein